MRFVYTFLVLIAVMDSVRYNLGVPAPGSLLLPVWLYVSVWVVIGITIMHLVWTHPKWKDER